MEEVTDVAFREMFARYSGGKGKNILRPSGEDIFSDRKNIRFSTGSNIKIFNSFVMFTEFVNVDGLLHPEGYEKLKIDLEFTEIQRPIVAQLWGTSPEKFYLAAQLVAKKGFDGIDINMGCPQDKEIGIGACAALIRNPSLAKEIIAATRRGASGLPVSVKTRLGYSKVEEMEEWIGFLLECNLSAITIHARTKQEKSKAPAHWEKIKEAVEIRDKTQGTRHKSTRTLIIGNGDIKSYQEGLNRIAQTGCDGVMVGRGAFGHPWFFRADNYQPTVKERLAVMLKHAELFNQLLGEQKSFVLMRKHFKAYASGFDGAHELRHQLLQTKSLAEARQITEEFMSKVAF